LIILTARQSLGLNASQDFQHPAGHAGLKLDHHLAKLSYFMSSAKSEDPKTKTASLIPFDWRKSSTIALHQQEAI
jgi:hypothetical protein